MQGLNLLSILTFLKFYWGFKINIIYDNFIIIPFALLILNYFHYKSEEKQLMIEKKALSLSKKVKKRFNIFTLSYTLLSIIIMMFLVYFVRNQNNQ
jgi:hypothetical protein